MSILLIVDTQPSFANGFTADRIEKIKEYVKTHQKEYSEIYSTVLQNNVTSAFVENLDWKECMEEEAPFVKGDVVLSKHTYGLSEQRIKMLKVKNATIDVIGGNLDTCIMAIAYQLFDNGLNFRILTDYCFSSSGALYYNAALKIMKHSFGRAVIEEENNTENVFKKLPAGKTESNLSKPLLIKETVMETAAITDDKEPNDLAKEKTLPKKKIRKHRSLKLSMSQAKKENGDEAES